MAQSNQQCAINGNNEVRVGNVDDLWREEEEGGYMNVRA